MNNQETCKCADLKTFFFHSQTENNFDIKHSFIYTKNDNSETTPTVFDSFEILKKVEKIKEVNFYLRFNGIELLYDSDCKKKEIKYFPSYGRFCFFDSYYKKCNCTTIETFNLHKNNQEQNVLHFIKLDGKKMLLSEAWTLSINVTEEKHTKHVDMFVKKGNVYLFSQPDPKFMYAKINDINEERKKRKNQSFFENCPNF